MYESHGDLTARTEVPSVKYMGTISLDRTHLHMAANSNEDGAISRDALHLPHSFTVAGARMADGDTLAVPGREPTCEPPRDVWACTEPRSEPVAGSRMADCGREACRDAFVLLPGLGSEEPDATGWGLGTHRVAGGSPSSCSWRSRSASDSIECRRRGVADWLKPCTSRTIGRGPLKRAFCSCAVVSEPPLPERLFEIKEERLCCAVAGRSRSGQSAGGGMTTGLGAAESPAEYQQTADPGAAAAPRCEAEEVRGSEAKVTEAAMPAVSEEG